MRSMASCSKYISVLLLTTKISYGACEKFIDIVNVYVRNVAELICDCCRFTSVPTLWFQMSTLTTSMPFFLFIFLIGSPIVVLWLLLFLSVITNLDVSVVAGFGNYQQS